MAIFKLTDESDDEPGPPIKVRCRLGSYGLDIEVSRPGHRKLHLNIDYHNGQLQLLQYHAQTEEPSVIAWW